MGSRRHIASNGEVETWVDWVQRATHEVRQHMVTHSIPSWVGSQQLAVQRWHQKVLDMADDRWARKVLEWEPEGFRLRGHPLARWEDQFASHGEADTTSIAEPPGT